VTRLVGLVVVLALAVLLGACGPKTTECKDGTHTTASGRGTCSGHGGVKGRAP